MADKLSWLFEMVDRISGPSKRATSALSGLLRGINSASAAAKSSSSAMSVFTGTLSASAVAKTAGAVWDVGAGFASASVGALAFRENSIAAFESILKSKQAAKDVYKEATRLAAVTPFSQQDVVGTFRKLAGAGFKQKDLALAFGAIGDVASLGGDAAEKDAILRNLTMGITQVKGKGVLMMEELRGQILEGARGVINQGDVFKHIAAQLRIGVGEVQGAISAGRVSADQGIFAIFKAIEERSGKVGSIMEAQGQTLEGLWSTLKDAPVAFFNSLDMDTPGFVALKNLLRNVIQMFDPATAAGKRLVSMMEAGSKRLAEWLGPLTGPEGLAKLESGFNTIVDGIEMVFDGAAAFGSAFMDSTKPIRDLFATMDEGKPSGQTFIDMMTLLGKAVGYVASGLGVMVAALNVAITQWDSIRDNNFIRFLLNDSRGSKRFDSVEAYLAKDAKAVEAERAAERANLNADTLSTSATAPWMKKSTGGVKVDINMSVDARGQDGDGISRKIKETLSTELASVFEQLAMEGGVR